MISDFYKAVLKGRKKKVEEKYRVPQKIKKFTPRPKSNTVKFTPPIIIQNAPEPKKTLTPEEEIIHQAKAKKFSIAIAEQNTHRNITPKHEMTLAEKRASEMTKQNGIIQA